MTEDEAYKVHIQELYLEFLDQLGICQVQLMQFFILGLKGCVLRYW